MRKNRDESQASHVKNKLMHGRVGTFRSGLKQDPGSIERQQVPAINRLAKCFTTKILRSNPKFKWQSCIPDNILNGL